MMVPAIDGYNNTIKSENWSIRAPVKSFPKPRQTIGSVFAGPDLTNQLALSGSPSLTVPLGTQ